MISEYGLRNLDSILRDLRSHGGVLNRKLMCSKLYSKEVIRSLCVRWRADGGGDVICVSPLSREDRK